MTRKKRDYKRPAFRDPKYRDALVGKMINFMMLSGKKSVAEGIFYRALEIVQEKGNGEPLALFSKALGNVRPLVEVRSRRVGGATYQVPTEVNIHRGQSLALRWIVDSARSRGERGAAERFAGEILDAIANKGASVKRREETHRMAEANKAFAHFKW